MWANYCDNGFFKVRSTKWPFIYMLDNTPFQVKPRRVLAGAWGALLGEKHSCARFEREDLLCCDAKFRFIEDLVAVSSSRRTLICCAQAVIFGNSFFKSFHKYLALAGCANPYGVWCLSEVVGPAWAGPTRAYENGELKLCLCWTHEQQLQA